LFLLFVALIGLSSKARACVGSEIYVKTDPSISVEQLAVAVGPVGKIESRVRGTLCYLIQLNGKVDDEIARQKLERIPGIRALEPRDEPVDTDSVRSLERKVTHLRAESRELVAGGGKRERSGDGDGGADYLGAYLHLIQSRAYPNDTFDWSSLKRARSHALKMPTAKLKPTRAGVRPEAASQLWEFSGPTNLKAAPVIDFGLGTNCGRINAVAFDPLNPNVIFAGAAAGGLWKSMDAGVNWTWLSASWPELSVNCIAIDPKNPFVMYVGLGDYHGRIVNSYGLMKTTDGGQTWTEVLTQFAGNVGVPSILIDPTNSQTIIAGTGDQSVFHQTSSVAAGSIWVSNDAGSTWVQKYTGSAGDVPLFPTIVAATPSANNVTMYAVVAGYFTDSSGLGRLLTSTDHGTTWTFLSSPVHDAGLTTESFCLAASPSVGGALYVLDSAGERLFRGTDGATNWTSLSSTLPLGPTMGKISNYNFSQAWYDFYLSCGTRTVGKKSSDVLYLGEIDVQESLDLGVSWQTIGGPSWLDPSQGGITHNDQHAFVVCPSNQNLSLFSNDGGIYRLVYDPASGKNTVTALNKNLSAIMFYRLACHPTNPGIVMGGTQDNGTPLAPGDLLNWINPGDGDGGGCAINQTDPKISYLSSEYLDIWRTGNSWQSNSGISPAIPDGEPLPFVCAMCLDPNNQYMMYTGTNELWKYDDKANKWYGDIGSTDLTNGKGVINAIAIAPSDSQTILTGSTDSALNYSDDGGQDWYFLGWSENLSINSLSINPTKPTDFLFGVGGTGHSHLYRGTASKSFFAYSDVSGSGKSALPDASLNAIARDIDDPQNTWYVATDVGIFQTTNAGRAWTNIGEPYGLPPVMVHDLVAVPGTRYLNAGTYGRGLWRLYLPAGGADLSSFTVTPTTIVGGASAEGTVTLTQPAPSGGTEILLGGDTTVGHPLLVTVPKGATSATFKITTNSTNSTFYANVDAKQVSIVDEVGLTILPIGVQSLAVVSPVMGGNVSSAAVYLDAKAPSGGLIVSLSSSSNSVTVPKTVKIAAGSSVGYFNVTTTPVASDVTATIAATGGSLSSTAQVKVEAAGLIGLTISPQLVIGGTNTPVTGTLTFNGPSTSAGIAVTLSSRIPAAATVPAKVICKPTAGNLTTTFAVTHNAVLTAQSVPIDAVDPSRNFSSATIGVLPFIITDVSASPSSITGGQVVVGSVSVSVAPGSRSGAISISLSTKSTNISIPASVTIPVGKTSATFSIGTKPVAFDSNVNFSATYAGIQQSGAITVLAPVLTGLTVSPTTIIGGPRSNCTGTVTINGVAPTGGVTVALAATGNGAASTPANVTIAAGKSSATFTISTSKVVKSTTIGITATLGGTTKMANLTVKA